MLVPLVYDVGQVCPTDKPLCQHYGLSFFNVVGLVMLGKYAQPTFPLVCDVGQVCPTDFPLVYDVGQVCPTDKRFFNVIHYR